MAINEIRIKRGDQLPKLTAQLQHVNGDPVDLTGATVEFQYRRIDADDFVGRAMTVTNALTGMIEYQWVPEDTVEEGRYEADFEATYADGSKLTVPTSSHVPMHVYEDLGVPGNGGGGNGGGTTVDLTLPVEFKPATQVPPGEFSPDKVGFFLQNTDGTELMRIVATDPDVANDYNSGNLYIGLEAGKNAAFDNTSAGYLNVGIGKSALYQLTTGYANTMIGAAAGHLLTDGIGNVALGQLALSSNQHGSANVAIGNGAGNNLGVTGETGCSDNTFIGNRSGFTVQSGDHNIFIGSGIDGTVSSHHELNIGGIIKGHLDTGRVELKAAGSAPADASLDNSQYEFWIDEAGNKLTAKVKYADGVTVKTGMIPLDGSSGGVASGTVISAIEPRLLFNETDAGVNAKLWDIDVNNGVFAIRTRNDADAGGTSMLRINRTAGSNYISAGTAMNISLDDPAMAFTVFDGASQSGNRTAGMSSGSGGVCLANNGAIKWTSTSDCFSTPATVLSSAGSATVLIGNNTQTDGIGQIGTAASRLSTIVSKTISLNDAEPRLLLTETDQGADAKLWDIDVNGGIFAIRTRTDADGAGALGMRLYRSGAGSISNVHLIGNFLQIYAADASTQRLVITSGEARVGSGIGYAFASTADASSGTDTDIRRASAKALKFGDGTSYDGITALGAPTARIKEVLCSLDTYSTAQVDKTDVTFADLTGCQVNVEANGVYAIGGHITCTCPAAGGAKVQIAAVTATATDIRYNVVYNVTGATSTISKQTALGAGTGVTAAVDDINITGYITVGTAGALKLQVAQNVASSTSNFYKGSWFRLARIA